jgi:hypothetical protein
LPERGKGGKTEIYGRKRLSPFSFLDLLSSLLIHSKFSKKSMGILEKAVFPCFLL